MVSIQGLVSVCQYHYKAHLDNKVTNAFTLRDIYKGNVALGQKEFCKRGKFEIKAIKSVSYVIGRTDWDRACIYFINPSVKYFFNNEILRESFYSTDLWDINRCERHSIFMSQAGIPLKGLHLAIKAINKIKHFYPDIKLYVAGKNYFDKPIWKLSYYEKYIINFIEKNHLKDNVIFTGFLEEHQMKNQYLNSHIFISASSIENSPNSVCEAMILGVPVISSFVGGVVNLITHRENGLYYQSDAPYMLAFYIKCVFDSDELAIKLSKNSIKTARKRHDPEKNIEELLNIYLEIARK